MLFDILKNKKVIYRVILILLVVTLILLSIIACLRTDDAAYNKEETTSNTEISKSHDTVEALRRNFILADLNGDGISEVIMHDMVDLFGGAGQYVLKVYIKSNDYSYDEIFDADTYLEAHPNMDIQAISAGNGTYTFQHGELEFYKEYNVPDSVYPYWFDEDGNAQEPHLFRIDSFNTVEIADVDTDGCDEIVFHQYTSIGWHANYLGDCISIFKLVDGDLKLISIDIDITN